LGTRISLARETEVMAMKTTGNVLVTAGSLVGHKFAYRADVAMAGVMQIIDRDSWKIRHTLRLEEDPWDLYVEEDHRIWMTAGSWQSRGISVVHISNQGHPFEERLGDVSMKSYLKLTHDGTRLLTSVSDQATVGSIVMIGTDSHRNGWRQTLDHIEQPFSKVGGEFFISPDDRLMIRRDGNVYRIRDSKP